MGLPSAPSTGRDERLSLDAIEMPDPRIVLRGDQIRLATDQIVDHPAQPADYTHTDGSVWTWLERWRIVGGVHLRMYDLVTPGMAGTC